MLVRRLYVVKGMRCQVERIVKIQAARGLQRKSFTNQKIAKASTSFTVFWLFMRSTVSNMCDRSISD
ncbi:hypothetical protein YERSI8AC_220050 [Enterobacterales bacterium 8AC]|nr:hypothetical protein YERSI8AC_220050 [Enterobacterales bacterium 8AC]